MWDQLTRFLVTTHFAQFVLGILIWAGIIYLAVTGKEVPAALVGAGSAVLGFWFGVRNGVNGIKLASLEHQIKQGGKQE